MKQYSFMVTEAEVRRIEHGHAASRLFLHEVQQQQLHD